MLNKVLITTQNQENDRHNWRTPINDLEKLGWKIFYYNDIVNKKPGNINNYFNCNPDIILYWCHMRFYDFDKTHIFESNAIKIFFLHDLDKRVRFIKTLILPNIDYIFTTYKNCFSKFFPKFDINKVFSMPFGIPREFIPEFKKNPDFNKLILSGSRRESIYQMRHYIYGLYKTKNKNNNKRKYKIQYLSSPGFSKLSHDKVAKNYIYFLNRFAVGFTCSSNDNTPYVVNKFFEIPASGALLLASDKNVKNELEKFGFKDGVNYISVTKKTFIDKLEYVTAPENYEEILKIRQNGYNLILNRHLREHRATEINEIVSNL